MRNLDPISVPLTGTQLIEASAGTGKTHTITTLYLRLLLEKKLSVEQILVVTFTQAATFELRARIRKRLRSAFDALDALRLGGVCPDPEVLKLAAGQTPEDSRHRLRLALATLDAAQIFTIHGFCQRILSEYAFESGVRFDLELSADSRTLLAELVQDFWTRELFTAKEAEVLYLKQSNTGITELTQLARTVTSFPTLDVVPTVSIDNVPESWLAGFVEARARFAEVWAIERETVQEILLRSEALSRNSYRLSSMPGWLEQLDALGRETSDTLAGWFDKVPNLTPNGLAERTNKGKITPKNPTFEALAAVENAHMAAKLALENWRFAFIGKLVAFVRSEFPKQKERSRIQSFDDLLTRLHQAVSANPEGSLVRSIRERYPAALIDEFQDTDPTQYGIFRTVYSDPKSTLFLIGDPKQAIYAFRGADIFAYLRAARDAAPNTYTLATNFRSDPGLVSAVNTLFERVPAPFVFEDIRYVHVEARPDAVDTLTQQGARLAPFEIQFFPRASWNSKAVKPEQRFTRQWSETILPRAIAREIGAALNAGMKIGEKGVVPGDIAVLTRTNRQALCVQAELRRLGVPSVLQGDSSVFEAPEARELAFVLRAVAEPNSQQALRAALVTTLFGQTADDLFLLEQDEAGWERWVEDFHRFSETWQRRGVYQMLRQVLSENRSHERLLCLVDGERRLTNTLHLGELLHHEASSRHLGQAGVLQWFDDMRHDRAAREGFAPESQQIRLESDALAVQLTTLHRSKGLEYPIVYCPYLWDGSLLFPREEQQLLYHEPDQLDPVKLDVRSKDEKPDALKLAEREKLAENLRLLYVALTRAKHRVVVVWGGFNSAPTAALGYILHCPRGDLLATPGLVAARLKAESDAEMLGELRTLSEMALGNISVAEILPGPAVEFVPLYPLEPTLGARQTTRSVASPFRSSSFSGLTKTAWAKTAPNRELGRDWDEEDSPQVISASAGGAPVTLEQFPRGAQAGTLLHSVLEHLDFQHATSERIEEVGGSFLQQQGLSVSALNPMLGRGLLEVLQTPLLDAPNPLSLSRIAASRRLNELEFTLPVHSAATQKSLTPLDLARALAPVSGTSTVFPKDYPSELSRLKFVPLQGFLRGFIDLVFEHEGLFYLADYKSNYLGPSYRDYAPAALQEAMAQHHYFLQYHLYTLALHRYLRQKLTNYNYETNFGGVLYLFLRGMAPRTGNQSGVFFHRPELRVVAALDTLFGSNEPAKSGAA